jgi:hypothetical protein
MADLSEQMTSLLEKEELPYADDATAATSRIRRMPKSKKFFPEESINLLESYKPEIREQRQAETLDENIGKMKSVGTGLLTGFAGLPSDVIEGVNFVNDFLAEKGSPKALLFKDAINEMRKNYGREAFDKKFTEITGIKSDGTNTAQIMGEILSPAGAFVATAKGVVKATEGATKLYKFLQDNFELQTKLLRGDVPPGAGGVAQVADGPTVSTATVGGQMSDLIEKNKDIIKAGVDVAKGTKTVDSGDPNRPIINLSEIGIKTPDGFAASKTYEKLEADAMGGVYSEERYKNLSLSEKDRLYQETGVYRGQDGQLRYKIPTADFQFNEGYLKELGVIEGGFNSKNIPDEGITLEQMLNAKDLYRNYANPAANGEYGLLKDIKIKNFNSYIKEKNLEPSEAMTQLEGTQAIYSRHEGKETIYVRGGLKSTVRNDLLHEIQHAIQHREGFNAGSSPNRFLLDTSTEFGKTYKGLLQNVYTGRKNALSKFEQFIVGGKQPNRNFLKDKDLFESVTDKLVKREYDTLLKNYSKRDSSGYFVELPADIRYLQTRNMLVDPPIIIRGESKPRLYKDYGGTMSVKFNENERYLANLLADNPSFQDYIRERILLEHTARNIKLMESNAHKEYIKVPGEVQARKIVEDDVRYKNIMKQLEERGEKIPTDPKERDILINRIFRQMKPSEKGVLQGQGVKVDSSGDTTSPIDGDEMSVINFPTTPRDRIKAKRKFDAQKKKKYQVEDARVSDEQLKLQNMKVAEAHAPMVKLIGAEETNKILNNKGVYNVVSFMEGTMPENSLVLKNLSERYTQETLSNLNPNITWASLPNLYKQKPFKKYDDGDVLRNADGETKKIELTSHLSVKDKKLHKNPNVVNIHKEAYVEPVYIFTDGSYARLTDLEEAGFKKIGKPNLSIIEGEQ